MRTKRLLPLLLLAAAPVAAQDPPAAGEALRERVVAAADSTQRYTLYLPPGWTAERRWPMLLLADPSGDAMAPIQRFRAAARRLGWVLASAHGSLANADTAARATSRAMEALLADAPRWGADPKQTYLAGFSGTARLLWPVIAAQRPRVAGLIVVGAGLPGPSLPWRLRLAQLPPFPVFAAAGEEDFNYQEVRSLDGFVAHLGMPHRLRVFDGPHDWLPGEVAEEALAWLRLQAVRDGARPADAWVDSLLQARRAWAEAVAPTSPEVAAAELRALARDFAGLRDTTGLLRLAGGLERRPAARRALHEQIRLAADEAAFRIALNAWLADARELPPERLADEGMRALRLDALRALAADSSNPARARSALRRLTLARVWAGSYQPRDAAAGGDHRRAAAWLTLARAMGEDAAVCTALARAQARAGAAAGALEALRCAVRHGAEAATLRDDPVLATLGAALQAVLPPP